MPLPAFTSSIDIDGSLSSNITTQWVSPLVYISTTDVDNALSSNIALSTLPGSSYIYTNDVELSGNLTVSPVLFAYTASTDNIYFTSNLGGTHLIDTAYTASADNIYFTSNLGGTSIINSFVYTSSADTVYFTSNDGGLHVPYSYIQGDFLSSLSGLKNQTYAYTQSINLLSSNLTGIKNTQVLPVYINFSGTIPYVRLNIPSNIPALKQVFVE